MSALWTSEDARQATGGRVVGTWEATGLSIDTRSLKPGDLFIPLKDERDGHEFIEAAYKKGANAVISEREITDRPALLVEDSFAALEALAVFAKERSKAKRIAVTGSVGKTSVKEMLACIFKAYGKTHASQKSFNNHWGVPLTLAALPKDADYAVFEMGMNHKNELSALSALAQPSIAAITKIASAHLAHFKSVEEIAKAKAEIFQGLVAGGTAIFPSDTPYHDILRATAGLPDMAGCSVIKNRVFGYQDHDDARIISSEQSATTSRSTIEFRGDFERDIGRQSYELTLKMAGRHWVENATLALLIAREAGIRDLSPAITALENMDAVVGRGQLHTLNIDAKQITLMDESYNANPASMTAAIAALGLQTSRRIAVLGDMLELGESAPALHAQLADTLAAHNIDRVLCCGPLMKSLNDALPKGCNAGWYADGPACLDGLLAMLQGGDVVMIKGSNASGMSKIVSTLLRDYNKKETAHVL